MNVSGNPAPKITWFKDQRLLDWKNPRFTLLKNNSLRIINAQVADTGKYDYMAENDKGQIFPRPWVVVPSRKYSINFHRNKIPSVALSGNTSQENVIKLIAKYRIFWACF